MCSETASALGPGCLFWQRTWIRLELLRVRSSFPIHSLYFCSVARVLSGFKMITAIHKHYTVEQWAEFMSSGGDQMLDYICASLGTSEVDRSFPFDAA